MKTSSFPPTSKPAKFVLPAMPRPYLCFLTTSAVLLEACSLCINILCLGRVELALTINMRWILFGNLLSQISFPFFSHKISFWSYRFLIN